MPEDSKKSDRDSYESPKKGLSVAKMSVAQVNAKLMEKNKCHTHQRHCDKSSEPHVPLSAQHLSMWAMIIKGGNYKSFTIPPPALHHWDAPPQT
ncbi:hypothetical protein Moror_8522 [Moniliophthora roreri MCA 2997]|uniref:Uncharacterized protein n=2 Tax=Moniliophthora roreri TaxID=221103 RepID=V2XSS8_MONRO|nr:hypothetical protein Moror_8522 [Moniliophthora roreri MCA 2997]